MVEEVVMQREARSPPPDPRGNRDKEQRVKELIRLYYEEGFIPPDIDPGEMTIQDREARFKVNVVIDQAKVAWLKEHTVTIMFREGARFLPKKVKDDIVRAYEDNKIQEGSFERDGFRRGRVKMESPNVVSYVAKSNIIAMWLVNKEHNELILGSTTYKLEFKPWMTKAQLKEQRREEYQLTFWVIVVQVPLDAMLFVDAHIQKAIGPIVRRHPTEPDRLKPSLVNIKFDVDPAARANMKDVIWVETFEGDQLEVKLASSDTPRCRRCRAFFHTEDTMSMKKENETAATRFNSGPIGIVKTSVSGSYGFPGSFFSNSWTKAGAPATSARVSTLLQCLESYLLSTPT
ncbi:hypothetical protein CBR_g20068 [Chara braunii]|uniref:Uncharacterized protein n=1 Tax=Chara braunii TaxID=69332 RepID=A0A388KZJ7_CHABU|nr:hypothetical protein CBR_g20068 [Chara braunii]|eukprot:GBG75438.1 hypothetical protein CBR_g20068 [Chara braunii]